jgi:hypothetical protein
MKKKTKTKWFDVFCTENIVKSFVVEAEDEDSAISAATKIICAHDSIESEELQYTTKFKVMKPTKKSKRSKTLGDIQHEQAVKKNIISRLAEKGVQKDWMKRNLKIIF